MQTKQDMEAKARFAINALQGTPDAEYSVDLFVSHHLDELDAAYWSEHFGASKPDAATILAGLVVREFWDTEEDGVLNVCDLTLPGNVADAVLSVRFDDAGEVECVDMES